MTDSTMSPDLLVFEDPSKKTIPSILNILTILTYIGCGLGFIGTVVRVFVFKAFETVNNSISMSQHSFQKQLFPVDKSNRAILIIVVFGFACRFMGVRMMRALKKKGFWLYLMGELIPNISTMILLGSFSLMTLGWTNLLRYLGVILFVFLYVSRYKYLVKE